MQKRGKWLLGGLTLLLVAIAAAPWLIPTGAWIGRIETEAGARLGAPVRIGGIGVALLLPHATVKALDVADGAIVVQRIAVYPRLWSLLSGYWSVIASLSLKLPPGRVRYCQPSLGTKRPPKARSTTNWSSTMKACERGTLCSRVKPWGIISLSQAGFGEGPVASDFSDRAVLFQFIWYMVWNWFW